ncbi:double strand break repair nuclease mre11 isoform X2 [Halictus rubicundus]|uniref:double strand break repair nuclease mre11 isoform X2 n=1 Tax=Halictus rubicundus TaxID=77578 RepID=UPI0040360266
MHGFIEKILFGFQIQFLSDPELIFKHCAYKIVNYEDPNLNISMPIFSIHGNHDDPSFGTIGSMDLLSVSGLINYFGKWTDLSQITIPPLVIKKGETHVALYGLSYINDQRLSRLLRDYKVNMLRPKDIPNTFNIFVLHQNRAQHLEHGYISESKLPNFLDLIIWGHEHECRITPEFVTETEYFVSQPGSSIATSLSEGEAKTKYIGLLSINNMKFKMKKLKLKTVRPFVFDNLFLEDEDIEVNYGLTLSESVYKFVDNHIENVLIPKAAEQLSGHPKQPIQPLIRLRIFHTKDEEVFDTIKLSRKYCEEVANPLDMVVFRKNKNTGKRRSSSKFDDASDDVQNMAEILFHANEDEDWNKTVQGGLKNYFNLEENKNLLTVLTVNGLNEALCRYIDRGDGDAFKDLVSHQMKKTTSYLENCDVDTAENIKGEIKNFRERREQAEKEDAELQELFSNRPTKPSDKDERDIENVMSSEDEEERTDKAPATRGRGRGRGTTARGRSRGGTRNTSKETDKNNETAKNPIAVAIKRPTKTTKQTKGQEQLSMREFFNASKRHHKQAEIFTLDDSD